MDQNWPLLAKLGPTLWPISTNFDRLRPKLTTFRQTLGANFGANIGRCRSLLGRFRPTLGEFDQICGEFGRLWQASTKLGRVWPGLGGHWPGFGQIRPECGQMLVKLGPTLRKLTNFDQFANVGPNLASTAQFWMLAEVCQLGRRWPTSAEPWPNSADVGRSWAEEIGSREQRVDNLRARGTSNKKLCAITWVVSAEGWRCAPIFPHDTQWRGPRCGGGCVQIIVGRQPHKQRTLGSEASPQQPRLAWACVDRHSGPARRPPTPHLPTSIAF